MWWTASLSRRSKNCFCPAGQKLHILFYLLFFIYYLPSFPFKI